MKELKKSYTFVVLRYVHDIATEEFVNVGVALLCPDEKFVGALCSTRYGRITKLFPDLNRAHFVNVMRNIPKRFEAANTALKQLDLSRNQSVLDIAQKIIPNDDSSLRWSSVGGGRTLDAHSALLKAFNRLVRKYEHVEPPSSGNRTDFDVWRAFESNLENRQVLQHLQTKTISTEDDEVCFEHAWKNGKWHCLQPVSFDYGTTNSMKDKAHRLLGQLHSLADAEDPFSVYFLVGEPRNKELAPAFERSLRLLQKSSIEVQIVREDEAAAFADRFSHEIAQHEHLQ